MMLLEQAPISVALAPAAKSAARPTRPRERASSGAARAGSWDLLHDDLEFTSRTALRGRAGLASPVVRSLTGVASGRAIKRHDTPGVGLRARAAGAVVGPAGAPLRAGAT